MMQNNGVEFQDAGTCWRAVGTKTVTNHQVLDYVDRKGTPTGIKYAIGPDSVTGQTRIAYVDYPKTVWTLEELAVNPEVPKLLMRCNVCSAMDQIANQRSPVVAAAPTAARAPAPVAGGQMRLSAGDVVLPKYLPFVATLAKKVLLRPGADAALSVVGSFIADAASGAFSDPQYKSALRALSDSLVDDIPLDDPNFVTGVKKDFISVVEAYRKDGDIIDAMKKNAFKRPEDIFSTRDQSQQSPQSVTMDLIGVPRRQVRVLRPPSLID